MSPAAGHRIDFVSGVLVESDHLPSSIGKVRNVAVCECGWHVIRQNGRACWDQVSKHMTEVGA